MMRLLRITGLALATVGMAAAFAAEPPRSGHRAITRPAHDVTPSFELSGKVAEVLVKRGDRVKAGQVIVKLDDSVERTRIQKLKAEAANRTRIKAAAAQLDQKKVALARLEELGTTGVATKWEIEQARLDTLIGELSLELAKFEHQQAQIDYEEARQTLERMTMTSPIDGTIEKVEVEVGESVDRFQPVVQILNNDPLKSDVPVPIERTGSLEIGQTASVRFLKDSQQAEGRITFLSAQADAASQTRVVGIEIPNPGGRPAGEHVVVTFAPPAAATDDTPANPTQTTASEGQAPAAASADANPEGD